MISVKIRWFAAFRELTGTAAESCDTSASSLRELFDELRLKHPSLGPRGAAQVAINDEVVPWDSTLHDGDEVLFFPPVAGG